MTDMRGYVSRRVFDGMRRITGEAKKQHLIRLKRALWARFRVSDDLGSYLTDDEMADVAKLGREQDEER